MQFNANSTKFVLCMYPNASSSTHRYSMCSLSSIIQTKTSILYIQYRLPYTNHTDILKMAAAAVSALSAAHIIHLVDG